MSHGVGFFAFLRTNPVPRVAAAAAIAIGTAGCGGPSADVTGTVLGIDFAAVQHVYFGGPYLVLTTTEDVDCESMSFIRQTYEEGVAPTTEPIELVQFTWVSGAIATGDKSIAMTDAEVTSLVLATDGEQLDFDRATAGTISLDALNDEKSASGSFDGVTYTDGSLSGSFTAEWCRNLRDR